MGYFFAKLQLLFSPINLHKTPSKFGGGQNILVQGAANPSSLSRPHNEKVVYPILPGPQGFGLGPGS
jgi:hypothetical protein